MSTSRAVYKAHLKWIEVATDVDREVLGISRVSAIILFLGYAAYLVFSLYTHHDLFMDEDDEEGEEAEVRERGG